MAAKLKQLGLQQVRDLAFHLPYRYEDRTKITPIRSITDGSHVQVEATVLSAKVVIRRQRMLTAQLSDDTGILTVRLFRFFPNQKKLLEPGTTLRVFGEARIGFSGIEMAHPELVRIADAPPLPETLDPIYPATEGLGQSVLRRIVAQALAQVAADEPDIAGPWLPDELGELNLADALDAVHHPKSRDETRLLQGTHPAQVRLALEELLAHRLCLRILRANKRSQISPALPANEPASEKLKKQLPFKLTTAQARVIQEIGADLTKTEPMMRLLQGDVGSGKTVVAAAAVVQAAAAGYQSAVAAPTEILAEQHFRTLSTWLKPLNMDVVFLTGKLKAQARRDAMERAALGADLIVGTHALMQDNVVFQRLGLAIVDEQHRFGVHQRLALKNKAEDGTVPHQLIMTATPIPRTLAMTAYADLDVSTLDELPPGRQPIHTVVMSSARRPEIIQRVAKACADGQQVYWVCTLVEESESIAAQAAADTAEQLAEELPDLSVGLVHGRLKAPDKEAAMMAFKGGETQLLVATTVIEVGVDVPNATVMIVENAERLGLSQLHQLRGRVGRGSKKSACVLMYQPPLGETAKRRLDIMRRSNDGFEIAREDLEIRGPGEVLGTRQTGAAEFRVANLQRDASLLATVSDTAEQILADDPQAAQALVERWVGEALSYAQV